MEQELLQSLQQVFQLQLGVVEQQVIKHQTLEVLLEEFQLFQQLHQLVVVMDTLMMLIKQEQEVQVVEVDTLKMVGAMEQQETLLL
tara:strand:- start:270 stop:527 length:258 start_codon:yes stop_codon:yes gene_type:complete